MASEQLILDVSSCFKHMYRLQHEGPSSQAHGKRTINSGC